MCVYNVSVDAGWKPKYASICVKYKTRFKQKASEREREKTVAHVYILCVCNTLCIFAWQCASQNTNALLL